MIIVCFYFFSSIELHAENDLKINFGMMHAFIWVRKYIFEGKKSNLLKEKYNSRDQL